MTTLRERFRDYRAYDGDIPPTAESHQGAGRLKAFFGAAIVLVVSFVVTMPISAALLAAVSYTGLSPAMAAIMALPLVWVGFAAGNFIGAPVADHILGIPREVSG